MSIKQRAVTQAIELLKSAGAQYEILVDGKEYTSSGFSPAKGKQAERVLRTHWHQKDKPKKKPKRSMVAPKRKVVRPAKDVPFDDDPPAPKKDRHFGKGISAYYKPLLQSLEPGGVVAVPVAGAPVQSAERLRGNIAAWCAYTWGSGNFTTNHDHKGNAIEVLRTA